MRMTTDIATERRGYKPGNEAEKEGQISTEATTIRRNAGEEHGDEVK